MAKQTFSAVKQEKPRAAVKGQESSNQHQKILKDELAEVIHQAVRDNRSYLMEHESKEILEGIGIATTGYLVARSEDEALAFCDKIGFPVVLKIVSPDVVHKTDAGGVKLNLMNAADVRKAYRDILETFKYQHIEGVAVQRMAPPALKPSLVWREIPASVRSSCSAWAACLLKSCAMFLSAFSRSPKKTPRK